MVLAYEDQGCHEGAEDLRENVVRHLFPGKALPDGKAYGNGWVEVTSGCRGAGYDGKGDAQRVRHADLEDGAVLGLRLGEGEDGGGRDAGVAVSRCY